MSQSPPNSPPTPESPEELARSATSFLFPLLVNMAEVRNTMVEKISVIINQRTNIITLIGGTRTNVETFIGLEEGHPPANNESIANLPRVEVVDPGKECAICLFEFGSGSAVMEMPCKHQFCEECIKAWLKIRGLCPICRFCMPVEEIQTEFQELQLGSWNVRFVVLIDARDGVAIENTNEVTGGEIESLDRDNENIG